MAIQYENLPCSFRSIKLKPRSIELARPIMLIAILAGCSFGIVASAVDGPLARHMALHILLMNALAPAASLLIMKRSAIADAAPGRWLYIATFLQIVVLWSWHAPLILEAALRSNLVHLAMQGSLLGTALLFWIAILSEQGVTRWRSILALLVTSKLYCLLGALLIFAPEAVYSGVDSIHPHQTSPRSEVSDQQLAGLLMLLGCALAYVCAGIVMAVQWLRDLAAANEVELGTVSISTSRQGS
jgi:putative membrane protein